MSFKFIEFLKFLFLKQKNAKNLKYLSMKMLP